MVCLAPSISSNTAKRITVTSLCLHIIVRLCSQKHDSSSHIVFLGLAICLNSCHGTEASILKGTVQPKIKIQSVAPHCDPNGKFQSPENKSGAYNEKKGEKQQEDNSSMHFA